MIVPMRQGRKPKTLFSRLRFAMRSVQAFFKMSGSGSFILLLVLFLVTIVFSTIDLYLNYIDPETGKTLDWGEAIYAVFAMLVFESPLPFPAAWITRIAFFAVPITGVLVLGQGLIRLGKSILNRDLWNRAMVSTYKEHTIICGLGQVSTRVIRWILDLNEEVIVIEQHRDNLLIEEVRSWGVHVMVADATRPEVLMEAGIQNAESIVPCTNDDLVNLS
ncbi:MAG: NAD-binding protein, partial [Ardenticatenales bacterium]|nr:NAD-binding protein [Ardenticatenales bacterium]